MESKLLKSVVKFSAQLYFGWVIFIGLLTLLPGSLIPNIDWNFLSLDKIIHLTVFTLLSFFGCTYFAFVYVVKPIKLSILLSFLLAVLYGTSLEYAQTFIPERGFDYADLTANIVGSIAGTVLFALLKDKLS